MTIIEEMRAWASDLRYDGWETTPQMLSKWADHLERSGALVPVPDGEAVLAEDADQLRGCIMNGLPYWGYYDRCEELCLQCLIDGYPAVSTDDTIVQPVRMVPITEAQIDE